MMAYGITRRPADSFQNLRRLNSFLDEAFQGWPFAPEGTSVTAQWVPAVDVFEDTDAVKIVAELPGVSREDVKISVENNVLTIRGEKKQVAEEKTERVHRYERSYGLFERTFSLPSTMDAEKIQADFENGVLTVVIPRAEKARPRTIEIGKRA